MTDKMPGSATDWTRRHLLKAGIGTAASIASPMLSRGVAAAEDNTVYIGTWGGNWQKAQEEFGFKPFTERTGIKVIPFQGPSLGKLKGVVETKTYDFDIGDSAYWAAEQDNLVEPRDLSAIDMTNIPKECLVGIGGFRNVVYSAVLAYRKDAFAGGGPQGWADFWDVKRFPGKRALMQTQAHIVMEYALLADGVPPDKVYPLDIDRAFRKMNEIKPHITVWWAQVPQSQQLIRDGEVVMTAIWSSAAQVFEQAKVPIEFVWNGAHIESGSAFYVARGTPRAKLAWRYMETFMDPKLHAKFAVALGYGPGNPKSFDFMTKEEIARAPNSPDKLAIGVQPDYAWLQPRQNMLKDKFLEWLAA